MKRWTELVSKWACVPPVTPRMAEILAGGPRPDDGGNAAVPSCRIVRFDTISSFELNPELHAALKAVPEVCYVSVSAMFAWIALLPPPLESFWDLNFRCDSQ